MNHQELYQFEAHLCPAASESPPLVRAVSYIFSNSFGENPKTGKLYKLSPNATKKRLISARHLFLVSHKTNGFVGYLFATEIPSSSGFVGWIDSLAVLPQHRRKGVGRQLVTDFAKMFARARWIGCATPNPIAALIITKAVEGKSYVGECNPPPPEELVSMFNEIRPLCQDLSGVEFNPNSMLVGTGFSPSRTGDTREWRPPHPMEPPPWWSSLENLSSQYEALLIIDTESQ